MFTNQNVNIVIMIRLRHLYTWTYYNMNNIHLFYIKDNISVVVAHETDYYKKNSEIVF